MKAVDIVVIIWTGLVCGPQMQEAMGGESGFVHIQAATEVMLGHWATQSDVIEVTSFLMFVISQLLKLKRPPPQRAPDH